MIDVIMPCWVRDQETLDLTVASVKSIMVGDDIKLIIVDNGSTLGGGKMREMADVYVRNQENLGYAKAVNQGLKLSGKLVAVANNDIRVSPNWWEVTKPLLEDGKRSVHYRMLRYEEPFGHGDDTWLRGKERWCSSSFFAMHNTQLYDEGFLNSLDDWDYWRRFRESGGVTIYTNKAEYQHLDSHTQQKIPNRKENDGNNLKHYIDKYGESPDEWLAKTYPEQLKVRWRPFP